MRPFLLREHTRPLTQVRFNKDGDLLFSVGRDGKVAAWFTEDGQQLGTYDGHNGSVGSIAISSDSTVLISGSADNTAKLWKVSGECLHSWTTETAVRGVDFGEGDKVALLLTEHRKAYPQVMIIVDIETKEILSKLKPEGSRALCCVWGALNETIISGHEDGSVKLWDVKTEKVIKSSTFHDQMITDIQLSLDKTYFCVSSKDGCVSLVDMDLKLERSYQTDRPINSASIDPSMDHILLGGGQDAKDVTTTSSKEGKFDVLIYHKIFGEVLGSVKGHFGPVNTLAMTRNGKAFASGGEDGYVRLYHFDSDYYKFRFPF